MSQAIRQTWSPATDEFQSVLKELKEAVGACMQCGTCTASCPNGFAMDVTPRRMWRMIQFGMLDQILESRTFWFCSSCYMCTLRCPRGLKLTAAMGALKRLASLNGSRQARKNGAFYSAFMEDVEALGRVQEMSLMNRFFFKRKDPTLPLSFVPVGMKMLAKGKLHMPSAKQRGVLAPMFAKAREMEGLT
ncbi:MULTISPECIES: 4Fe-4S dicluster domain-containing protein [unclassified Pseudodesulfovibrio]|uniref:4Fe-4S dicluster domain-containing protein n=1 Tax=unclassified Pseudodesulfovibrio TaxID=2661612 RepID=UPI000FEBFE27|nr:MULTISPECIES: 4Fe-4S dicluster domain-containing protein [unclassified Pseudodesulfovibrio]MCJ2165262.1 4Fe-4S dicluster domain-containing protein [Pseudodesulfovibrio sp. S3-i]RWU03313.1 4Fe-4S dicluster domain-containing protein [Pseudodesulfovibrio sp. S3]